MIVSAKNDHRLFQILQKRATGDVLLREVFKHVGLDEEKEYFGLSFQDNKGQVVSIYYCGYGCIHPFP